MRIGVLVDHRVVAIDDDDRAVDITSRLVELCGDGALPSMLGGCREHAPALRRYMADPSVVRVPAAELRFTAPSPSPSTVLAAPVNFREHAGELGSRSPEGGKLDASQMGLIVLASGSVTGPDGAIELPNLEGREFHFEGEVAVVIGKEARSVPEHEALDYVLGYTGLIDVTMRLDDTHREERSMRKSFHTFTPIGPYIVTADTVADPAELSLHLSLNGEARQQGTLRDLIVSVPQLVSRGSEMLPLQPGDLIATGTPAGVGPIVAGDEIALTASEVGTLRMPVVVRRW